MKHTNKLTKSEYVINLLKIAEKIIFNHGEIARKTSKSLYDIGTKKEKYIKNAFFSYYNIYESIKGLDKIIIFFSINPLPKCLISTSLSKIDYYQYHYEMHHIKISTIIDMCVNYINEIYRIGMPIKKCNVYSILENLNIKETQTAIELKNFNTHFQQLKKNRNLIIHQNCFKSKKIECLDNSILDYNFISAETKKWFKKEIFENKKNVIKEMNNENEIVSNFVFKILETLTEPFLFNIKCLKEFE